MPEWTKETVEEALKEKGWVPVERPIPHGSQFDLFDGTKVNCYDSGSVVVQGKDSEIKREADQLFVQQRRGRSRRRSQQAAVEAPSRVFIVYGHDADAREQLELLLRRFRLEPIVLQNLPGSGDTIIEKLEDLTNADYACVLVTPDDEGRTKGPGEEFQPRARQNVVLELGMVLARLGRKRVSILIKGSGLEPPSDIDGLLYLPFADRVDEVRNELAANLQMAGFNIQVRDLLG